MVPHPTRRRLLTGAASVLALSSGCLSAGQRNPDDSSESLTCPELDDETTVSCVTEHSEVDLRPAITPLKPDTENQSFVLRNRSRKSITVSTAGIHIFWWDGDSWTERGNERRNATSSKIEPGDAFYWLVEFSDSRDKVYVRDAEVIFPEGATGQYAATVAVEDEEKNTLRCGTLFDIE